ncbi:cell division protein ZapA [Roseospira visakhapatnamensis]|uniref:Cell division protein ZapA n=1 Tax=Roseospira visakhapatnamensis TaxID=390880 RepID=A0A7W6RF75_9PROT|nr:cell division protein ZapA [Roseospira visakhapatnamensis]MBB4266956.1 cell division protein ZapA [Roseospira visakhapatnamensis]
MAQVSLTINGRDYRIRCDPGEEDRVRALGTILDAKAHVLAGRLGHVSEGLLMVMVGLTLADDLAEVTRDRDEIRARLEAVGDAADQAEAQERLRHDADDRAAQVIESMARRIEGLAERLERP